MELLLVDCIKLWWKYRKRPQKATSTSGTETRFYMMPLSRYWGTRNR